MTVGLVVVSHSASLADGVRDLAAQMAPSVPIVPAGGDDDGGIGTSFDRVLTALEEADEGDGVVALYDLGSALLTTETALEMGDPDIADRRVVVDAPLVEGAIAAAVEAEAGADLAAVAGAARATGSAVDADEADSADAEGSEQEVEIVNPLGLHARPAATLARLVSDLGARVSVAVPGGTPVDLRSVMSVVGLATRQGDVVRLIARGTRASQALERVAAVIRDGFGERVEDSTGGPASPAESGDHGAAGAAGIAVGPLIRLNAFPRDLPDDAIDPPGEREAERSRLGEAVDAAAAELDRGDALAQAHAAILRDPTLAEEADAGLSAGAARAWWAAVNTEVDRLAAADDELVAARAADVRDAGAAVLRNLGVELSRVDESVEGAVVLADDVGPAEVPALVDHGCAALVLRLGSPTAHAVVVARGLGLPLVIRAGASLDDVDDGTTLIVDGTNGSVEVDPAESLVETARERVRAEAEAADELRASAGAPVTYRGEPVLVAANVGSVADARAAVAGGADGVGLLRTELLVLDRARYPTEDEQTADLTEILEVLGDRPVVVRVLDAGGDKPVRSLDLGREHHGFLGVRGLRYLLEQPDLLRTQLRAILRAAHRRQVSVMAPMVTVPSEARAFRQHVDDAVRSLRSDGLPHGEPSAVGVMIEVPAAALSVREFAGAVDFLSVGSNDLLSYLTAAERTEAGVAHLLDVDSPALARVLDLLAEDAHAIGVPLAVCGEIAGEPSLTDALLARGVHELSMAPARIPLIKNTIRAL